MNEKLLVTGASGHFGRAVLEHLLDRLHVPAGQIIATSRKPEALAAFAGRGVEVRAADFDVPETLAAAFSGAARILIVSTDAFDRPGARLVQHSNAIHAAAQAGAAHVIYTSMPNPEGSPILIAPDHLGTETALAESGLPGWTVLRNNWYFETLPMAYGPALASGQFFTAAGAGRVAFIAREDLALAAATVLSGTATGKRIYTLTGAEAFSGAEMARLIGAAFDRPIEVVQVPVEGLVEGMVGFGMPRPLAEVLASFDLHTAQGRVGETTPDFAEITGTQPLQLENWLAQNRAAFAPPQ